MGRKAGILYCLCLFLIGALSAYAQTAETSMHQAGQLYKQNNYSSAQRFYLQALKQAETENNSAVAANACLSLVRCYYLTNDHAMAFKWSYNALHIIQKHHLDSLLSHAYYLLGALYIEDRKVDSAEKYSFKAIDLMQKENDFARLSQTYSTLAELHLNTSNNKAIIESLIANAEKYAALSQNKAMMAFAVSKRYNYAFFLKKDYDEALGYVNIAERLNKETGNTEAILNSYRGKAECLIMLRDTSARTYMLQWFAFKDSVLQAEKAASLSKYETLYETEKKENDNKLLKQKIELQRLLLVIGAVVVLMLTMLSLWIYSNNNLKKKQHQLLMLQNLQYDKERIARDLHDNVGGQLSYIIYSLDGINDENETKRSEIIRSIDQSVRSVISSLRETIWAISDANIRVQDFSDKLKVFARTLFKHSTTHINFIELIQSNRELNALMGLNLYRICQEILNNAFKYANATEVKIDVQCTERELLITISDNGVGFDITQHNKEKYGLQNIRKRTAEFRMTLTLESEINKGTTYKIQV